MADGDQDNRIAIANPWTHLRRHTPARIALGRTGTSIPTAEHLAFQLAHARARSAVHHQLGEAALAPLRDGRFGEVLTVESAAPDRPTYLQRPDLGRRLSDASAAALAAHTGGPYDIALVVADGLSATAIEKNIVPFLEAFLPVADRAGWRRAPLVLARQARVAIGDEIGAALGADLMIMLIGERPGLSSTRQSRHLSHLQAEARPDRCRSQLHLQRPPGWTVVCRGGLQAALSRVAGAQPKAFRRESERRSGNFAGPRQRPGAQLPA